MNLSVYLKFKNMIFIMLFLVLFLPFKDCFKVIHRFPKLTLSTGYVILYREPLSTIQK